MRALQCCLLPVLALMAPAPAGGQVPRGLGETLRRADAAAYSNRIAAGEATVRAGEALASAKGLLPSLRLEGAYTRTTDPLTAFGFTLRQRVVTPEAFAPAVLNFPAAVNNVGTGAVVEQPLFNADAWLGRKAARQTALAAASGERWTRASTALDVLRAYWGAVLASDQEGTMVRALDAARSHVRDAESLVRQGMATKSDALLASVKAGEVEAALLNAQSEARLAKRALAVSLGQPEDTLFVLPESLPLPDRIRATTDLTAAASAIPGLRADVAAAREELAAESAGAQRARSLFLPRVNSFGRLDWSSAGTPFGGRSAWTAGIMVSWSPFTGGSELAEIRSARGREAVARAKAEAAEARAALELARTSDAVTVDRARLDIADAAVAQAREAHRIVARKYEGGLATVTELFEASSAETSAALRFSSARYDLIVALGEYLTALGTDLRPLLALDD
jgi:outer membrane protein